MRRLLLDVEGDPVGRRGDVSVGRSSSADVSAIAGTWRSVDDNQLLFCKVGTVIRTDGAPTTTGSTTCDYPLAWNVVNRLDVEAGGKLSLSFVHPDLARRGAQASNRVTRLATCRATAARDGRHLRFADLVCTMSVHDGSTVDASGLADPTWKLDGACLSIDGAWFEQKSGECDQHSLEQKFNDMGNAIANAS